MRAVGRVRRRVADSPEVLYRTAGCDAVGCRVNVRIRRRASDFEEGEDKDYARRPVIELTLCIGDRKEKLNVNLADRRRFSQPMLIGRDALRALHAMVDAADKFAVGEPRCEGVDSARRATIEKD